MKKIKVYENDFKHITRKKKIFKNQDIKQDWSVPKHEIRKLHNFED